MNELYELKKVKESSDGMNAFYALEEEKKGMIKTISSGFDDLSEYIGYVVIKAVTNKKTMDETEINIIELSGLIDKLIVWLFYVWCVVSIVSFDVFDPNVSDSIRLESLFWAGVMILNAGLFKTAMGYQHYGFSALLAVTLVLSSTLG